MSVYGCQIVSKLSADSPEGFSSMVSRGDEIRGPFATISEAVACARTWSREEIATAKESLISHEFYPSDIPNRLTVKSDVTVPETKSADIASKTEETAV